MNLFMTQISFNAILDHLSEYFGQEIKEVGKQVLWNTTRYWSDDEIKAACKSIENEETVKWHFTKVRIWNKYKEVYLEGRNGKTETSETHHRQKFYLVTTCPRCGYGNTQEWEHKFDRFDERLHDKCKPCHKWLYEHGETDAAAAQKRTGKCKRLLPANEVKEWVAPPSVCVYQVSLREENRPVFGNVGKINNAAVSDDGRMHRTAQVTETVDLPF